MIKTSKKNSNSLGLASIYFILVIFLAFLAITFWLIYYSHPQPILTKQSFAPSQISDSSPIASFIPISSQGQSYPILLSSSNIKKMIIYNLGQPMGPIGQPILLKKYGSSLAGKGKDSPLVSPDLGKIAYFYDDGLHIISSDSKTDRLISTQIKSGYFSGWSPDSNKLIVYGEPILASPYPSDYNGYNYPDYDASPSAFVGYRPNFYLIDTEKGSITPLSHVLEFANWIDNEHFLTQNQISPPYNYSIHSVSNNLEKNMPSAPNLDSYFGIQQSFSQDGKKWALSFGRVSDTNAPGFGKLVLANFPQTTGIEIDSGGWADVQSPLISPDGTQVLYIKKIFETKLWQNGNTRDLVQGRAETWVDNNRFIYTVFDNSGVVSVNLYNLENSQNQVLELIHPPKQ